MAWNLFKFFLFLFGIAYGNLSNEKSGSFLDADSVIGIIRNISGVFQKLEGLILVANKTSHEVGIISNMEKIKNQISFFGRSYDFGSLNLLDISLSHVLHERKKAELARDDFHFRIFDIDGNFTINEFILLLRRRKDISQNPPKISRFLQKLHDLNVQNGTNPSFFSIVSEIMKSTQANQCSDENPGPRQYFQFEIWFVFVSSLLKSFVIDTFWNQYYRTMNINGIDITESLNYTLESQIILMESMLKDYYKMNIESGSEQGRRIQNCEAEEFKRDVTFIELERLFQLVVIGHSSCEGLLSDCQKETNIKYYPAPESSSRRYHWITIDSGKTSSPSDRKLFRNFNGSVEECLNSHHTISPKHGIVPETRDECQNLVCTCEENTDDSTKSTFIISSKLEEANVTNNMVVTGVRFTKKDRIIYTQIRQGKLMPGGQIRQDTEEWKPVKTIQRSERKDRINSIIISSELKSVNLNDLQCPDDNHVITGVGLRESKLKANMNRIVLTISCHPVNFERGILLPANGTGLLEDKILHPNKLEIGGLPPDKVPDAHQPDSSNDQFVEIGMSDIRKDAGQSVIPWFDAQNVVGTASVPLSGVGLYHRGAPNSGGFLAYRLLSIDYSLFVFPRKVPRVDPYAKERKVLMLAPPQRYCSGELARTLCIVCNGSYHSPSYHRSKRALWQLSRGISNECCESGCSISNLLEYCGPVREDLSALRCT